MKKFFKYLRYTLLSLAIFFALLFVYLKYESEIEYQWLKFTYKVPTSIAGISPGDSLSDAIFHLGKPIGDTNCEGKERCGWKFRDKFLGVFLEDNRVVLVSTDIDVLDWSSNHPLRTTEGLIDKLGEPAILCIANGHLLREYTYLDGGISYLFEENRLKGIRIGAIDWRCGGDGMNEYFVKGKQYCPGESCPFDDKGDIKPEFKNKSYRDLL